MTGMRYALRFLRARGANGTATGGDWRSTVAFLKEHSTGYMALKAVSRSAALLPPVSTTLGNASSSKTPNKGGANKLETYSIAHRVQPQWMAEVI